MIKLPEEIVHMIKTIEDAGFEAYAVGGCVRDSILGRHPEDWDLTSNASRDTLEALFPDAAIVNRKLGVMRISEGWITADIAAYRSDGEYKDYRRPETVFFTEDINEDLKRRDFTMNAIAVSPEKGIVDPYRGIEDIGNKLIRGIGEPRVRFEEDALRILRAVRFAAQLDFTIDGDTVAAMKEKAGLLEHISAERIREEFIKTITSKNSGKGLRLLLETDVMPYILGNRCIEKLSAGEMERLALLAESIDRTETDLRFRLALFYRCFTLERASCAIESLSYSNELKRLLRYALCLTAELEAVRDKAELKRLISRIGLEDYRFLQELSEQRSVIGDLDETSFRRITAWFSEIRGNREPVFLGELAVNGDDLKNAGISEGAEIGRILKLLLDVVHEEPEKNCKDLLLELAAGNGTAG